LPTGGAHCAALSAFGNAAILMAARITARLPIASLRLHSHTDRMFASPDRKRYNIIAILLLLLLLVPFQFA
jgi:hypothetical protein